MVAFFAISTLAPIVPGPVNVTAVDPTMRSRPPPAIEPVIATEPEALSWKPGAIVSVAPGFTVRPRHAAFATPAVDGLFGVPDAMTASTPALGTPELQFPPALQFVLTVPVHVVWASSADAPKTRTRTNTKISWWPGIPRMGRPSAALGGTAVGRENRRRGEVEQENLFMQRKPRFPKGRNGEPHLFQGLQALVWVGTSVWTLVQRWSAGFSLHPRRMLTAVESRIAAPPGTCPAGISMRFDPLPARRPALQARPAPNGRRQTSRGG